MNGHKKVLKICSDYFDRYSFSSYTETFEILFCKSIEDTTPALRVLFNGVSNYNRELVDTPDPDCLDMLIEFEYSNGKCLIHTDQYEFTFSYTGEPIFEPLPSSRA